MQKTAAALEPEVIPMTFGFARGLRSIVWKVFPAMPKANPAKRPASILGRRIVLTAKDTPWICSPDKRSNDIFNRINGVPQ